MKKILVITLFVSVFFSSAINSHGFAGLTAIKWADKVWSIEQFYRNPQKCKLSVSSFDLLSDDLNFREVVTVGRSKSNCYIRLSFDTNFRNDILCTPNQELFSCTQQQFLPACQLCVGDELLSIYQESVIIKSIELIKKPLMVYALEVVHDHNFFVGNYGILAHNMLFSVLTCSLGNSIASGAAIGSFAGCFGPITLAGGVALGGVIGIAIKLFSDKIKSNYKLHFNIDKVAVHLRDCQIRNKSVSDHQQNMKGRIATKESSNFFASGDPEDPDEKKSHPYGKYEDAPYHHANSRGNKNPCPKNGQVALDNSLRIKETSPHRIGISNEEFVVLKETLSGLFHGYVCKWADLDIVMQNVLKKAKWANHHGRILI